MTGSDLGAQQGNSQLLLNGAPIAVTAWSDTSIQFTVPADDPATGVALGQLAQGGAACGVDDGPAEQLGNVQGHLTLR